MSRAINAIVEGIVASDKKKQDLGRRFAYCLGLTPGGLGRDGGIDGYGDFNDLKIYFQSKLSRKQLDASFVADFVGNLIIHEADLGIMLAGVGYTDGFHDRLDQGCQSEKLNRHFKFHLLTLKDIFSETSNFEQAMQDLPPLQKLTREAWETINL